LRKRIRAEEKYLLIKILLAETEGKAGEQAPVVAVTSTGAEVVLQGAAIAGRQ
jgi:hypothetical protein